VWFDERIAWRVLVSAVGYRYKEVSSSLGKSLYILLEWYVYHNISKCITIGIIQYVVRHRLVVSS